MSPKARTGKLLLVATAVNAALLTGGYLLSESPFFKGHAEEHLFTTEIIGPYKVDFYSTRCNGLYDRVTLYYPDDKVDEEISIPEYEEVLRARNAQFDDILNFHNCGKPSKRKNPGNSL